MTKLISEMTKFKAQKHLMEQDYSIVTKNNIK